MEAVFAWLDEAEAVSPRTHGLVVLMQADPFVGKRMATTRCSSACAQWAPRRTGRVFPRPRRHARVSQRRKPLPGLRRLESLGLALRQAGWRGSITADGVAAEQGRHALANGINHHCDAGRIVRHRPRWIPCKNRPACGRGASRFSKIPARRPATRRREREKKTRQLQSRRHRHRVVERERRPADRAPACASTASGIGGPSAAGARKMKHGPSSGEGFSASAWTKG